MSIYPAPSSYPAIFNPEVFLPKSSGSGLSSAQADAKYAKLAGNQTIVGAETFTGGILTNNITPTSPSNQVTVSSGMTVTDDLAVSNNLFSYGYIKSSGGFYIGSHIILGSSWTASTLSSGTYSYTISLSSITSGDFTGQIYISVKNTTTASLLSQLNYFAVKSNGTLTLTSTSSAPNNFGTYTLNSVLTNKLTVASSNTAITVSTYTTSSSVCWYFVGAVV